MWKWAGTLLLFVQNFCFLSTRVQLYLTAKTPGTETTGKTLRKTAGVVPCHLTSSWSSARCLNTSFTLYLLLKLFSGYVTWSFPSLFLEFSLFLYCVYARICGGGGKCVVYKPDNAEYSLFLWRSPPVFPCLLQGTMLSPTSPPGFPYSSTLQWTESPHRLFNDFSKGLTRSLPLKCLYLRGVRKRNMQFKPQNFTRSFWRRIPQALYSGIWAVYFDDMQLLSTHCCVYFK